MCAAFEASALEKLNFRPIAFKPRPKVCTSLKARWVTGLSSTVFEILHPNNTLHTRQYNESRPTCPQTLVPICSKNRKLNGVLNMLGQIEQCIQKGVERAYFEELALTGCENEFEPDIAEYLFTVNVAQRLLEAKRQNRWNNHSICLEYDATQFKANAFPQFLLNPRRDRRTDHFSSRPGRIDTVVLSSAGMGNWRSVVGIELKGINPQRDLVFNDLHRLADAMSAIDPIDANSVVRGYCAFVLRHYNRREALEADQIRERVITRQADDERDVANELRGTAGIVTSVHFWEIWVRGATQVAETIPEELWEYGDIARETGSVTGVLVSLRRRDAII